MTIFAQRFNICRSKFERSPALIAPSYAPGNSDWWTYGFVLILLSVDSSRWPRKG